jgi:phosphatidylglycerol lysyltransferase
MKTSRFLLLDQTGSVENWSSLRSGWSAAASGLSAAEAARRPSRRGPGSALVAVVAAATLGSGVLNLYSLMRPGLSGRLGFLSRFFPVEFVTFSRFLVLVAGFALITSSFNIYKRKRRAFQAVAILTALSALLHLTKGVDYEEASLSLLLLVVLLAGRHRFTVRSEPPDIGSAIVRVGAAGLIGTAYGILGFWLLDPREFGIGFTVQQAARQTLLYLTLSGDPRLVPHTRHATWFLHSLWLMSGLILGYAVTLIFRPVRYRLQTLPLQRAAAEAIVSVYGRSSLDFFKPWPDKSHFFSPSRRTFLAYSAARGFALVLGDPVGPAEEVESTVTEFSRFCDENDWGFAFYQTLPDFLPAYARCGLARLKLGEDAIVDLAKFDLDARDRRGLRTAVHKLERQGLGVRSYEPPLTDDLLARLEGISEDWLAIPGRRERQFTLGRFEREYLRRCPVLAASTAEGEMQAFVNVVPSYHRGETTIDLMRRRRNAPNGVMEFLLVKLLFRSRDQGFARFSLGLAPMSGFQAEEHASPEERAIHFFFQHLNAVFSFTGLRAYKAKFATDWEPRYVVYRHVLDLPRVAFTLARVSEISSRRV